MGSLGTKNPEFVDGLVAQLLGVSARDGGKFHARGALFRPSSHHRVTRRQDELEAMQVAQMAAVHEAMMGLAGEVARTEVPAQTGKRDARHEPARANVLRTARRTQTLSREGGKHLGPKRSDSTSWRKRRQRSRDALTQYSEADSGIAQAILGRPCPTPRRDRRATISTDAEKTDAEDQALASARADPPIKFTSCKLGDVTYITVEANEDALKRAFGTGNSGFLSGLIHQIANAASAGRNSPDDQCIRFLLGFVKSSCPRDETDAALAAQMAAAHVAAMRVANRLAHAETLEEQDSAERTFNKLARTFAGLVEARQRYRAASDAKTVAGRCADSSVTASGPRRA